jgi:hypothetical protein
LKHNEFIDFDVEAWYKILQSQTFETEFIPISITTAQAFVNYYQTRYNSKRQLNYQDLKSLDTIQHQLKYEIFNTETSPFHIDGALVRLSSRSPKDGNPLDSQALSAFYHQEVSILQSKHPNEYESAENRANMQLIAYSQAQVQTLKVTNELEVLNLILSSERVFIDLLAALGCQQMPDNGVDRNDAKFNNWNTNIVIRKWSRSSDPSMEFRCFVHQSELTAISQYNHYCKFYHLQNETTIQQIKITIIEYWQQIIKPLFNSACDRYSNYIIDRAILENKISDKLECIVIELNPFATIPGASLFNWKSDFDQLTGKMNAIEIRIRSSNLPNIVQYTSFILESNGFIEESRTSSCDDEQEPFFKFLNEFKTNIVSQTKDVK